MILRRARYTPEAHALAVQLIIEMTEAYNTKHLMGLIEHNLAPDWIIEKAVAYLGEHPELGGMSDVEFRAAAAVARPDIGEILDTPAGRKWSEIVGLKIGAKMAVGAAVGFVKGLFGR